MDNVTFKDMPQSSGQNLTFAFIENADGSITSMPKTVYDAQQAAVVMNIPPVAPSAEPSDTIAPAQSDEIAPSEGTTNVS